MQANDFPQLLEQLAGSERDAHRYRENGSVVELTYGELITEADRLARGMHRLGVRRGDRVGLVLHSPREFVPAFLGCVRAGFIAVPLYPRGASVSTTDFGPARLLGRGHGANVGDSAGEPVACRPTHRLHAPLSSR
ncbi:MAG: acyl--CoA ligase [Deltaproteobacteria bacterium]|nr:acyl--CoA ligase [Deltaproteobacteria bacterium]